MSSRSNNNYIYSGSMPALEMMLQKLLFLCGNLGKINGWYSTTIHPTHAYFTNYYQADPECVIGKNKSLLTASFVYHGSELQ